MNTLIGRSASIAPAISRRTLTALFSYIDSLVSTSFPESSRTPHGERFLGGVTHRRGFHVGGSLNLGFRGTGTARAEFAVDDLYREDDKPARKGGDEGGLEISKLGIAPEIVSAPAKKGITKLFPIQCAWPFVGYREFSSGYEPHASEGLIPPELLTSKKVLTPDRVIGQYADLVTRVTNFHNEDKGLMVLAGDVFDVPIRKDIIHRVVRWQLAKRQQGTHSTKTISEVSGTGRKPYRQKGTGQARHGTLRGPQFRHGAAMHGPKPRSHAFKLQKKVRRLGLKIALSARLAEGKLLVFEDLALPSHKTKNIVSYVSQMENTKKVLLVDGGPVADNLKFATGNLHYVNVLPSIGLNVYSILQHDTLVMTRDAVDRIVERMHTPINR